MNWNRLILVIALIAGLVLGGVQFVEPSQAQSSTTNFTNVRASGDLRAGDDLTVGDDATITGDLTVGADISASPQTTLTLTMNGWITPTGTLQVVSAAGAVSISGARIAPGTQGQVLILLNGGAQTVTITETTGLISAGNIALGALDSATLVYRVNSWYQIGASNN